MTGAADPSQHPGSWRVGTLRRLGYCSPPGTARGWAALAPLLAGVTLLVAALTLLARAAYYGVVAAVEKPPGAEQIYIADVGEDSARWVRLTNDAAVMHWGPAWSPDGRALVFTIGHSHSGDTQLWIVAVDGSSRRQLTHDERGHYLAAWSPDGSRLVFMSQLGDDLSTAELFTIDADGSNLTRLTTNAAQEYGASWSPDGRRIIFGSKQDGTWQLYVMNADGSDQTRLESGGGNAPAWSQDGRLVAFVSDRYGRDDIFVMDAGGGGVRRLTTDGANHNNPAWAPDSQRIAFASRHGGADDIIVVALDGRRRVNVTRSAGVAEAIATWSPDGRRMAFHGRTVDDGLSWYRQALRGGGLVLQALIVIVPALLLVRRWVLPFGALTVLLVVTSLVPAVREGVLALPFAALGAGVACDLLLWWLTPSARRPTAYYLFAGLMPLVVYGLVVVAARSIYGEHWPVLLAVGTVLTTTMIGACLGRLLVAPLPSK